jgi:outer membrane protein assembly factor BamB
MFLVNEAFKKNICWAGLALVLFAGAGCTTPAVAPRKLSFKAVWVQNTLANKNPGFRKINRFSPIYDSRENQIIVANSLEGLSSFNLFYTLSPTIENYNRKKVWTKKIDQGFEAPGLVNKGQLFIGGLNGRFYSINVKDGSETWSFDTGAEIVAEPTLVQNTIYFMNAANQLFALDATTGKQLWVYNRQDTNSLITIRGGSKPTVVGGVVYVGFSDGSLVALKSQTGTPQWEAQFNKNIRFKDIDSSPIFSGDNLYINSYDDFLYCLNKASGTVVWKIKSGGTSSPLVVGDRLIYTTSDSSLIAANKNTGQIIWSYKNVAGIATDVVNYKGLVVFGESQGKIKALDLLTGELKAGFDPGRGIMTKPTLIEDDSSFLFISGEGNLYQVQLVQDNPDQINFIR